VPAVPLVVVPGLGLAEPVYAGLVAALPRLDVRVVTLPGYGQPAPRGARLAPPALAAAVLAETARLDLDRFALLGHSSSSQVVAEAAAADSGRVAAVVLVGPTTDPRARTWPRLVARWLRTAAHERPGQAPLLARVYARTGLVSMARAMDSARRHDVRPAVARAGVPLLVVRGRADRIAPEDWARALAQAPGARAVTLPVGAHMVPVTHPRHLATLVDSFLASATAVPR
jgi:pimeloyl-ACP methyl ester carboxylesterase